MSSDVQSRVLFRQIVGPFEGFTLIEVLVALTILSLSLALIYSGFSSALLGGQAAVDYQKATLLAESKLDSIGIETPLEEGQALGEFDNKFRWELLVTPYSEEDDQELAQGRTRLVKVVVSVFWGSSSDEKSVSLSSLRLLTK